MWLLTQGSQRSSQAAADTAPQPSLQRQPTLLQRMPGRRLVNAATMRLKPVKYDAGYAGELWHHALHDGTALCAGALVDGPVYGPPKG